MLNPGPSLFLAHCLEARFARFEREGVVGALEHVVVNADISTSIEDRAIPAVAAAVRIAAPCVGTRVMMRVAGKHTRGCELSRINGVEAARAWWFAVGARRYDLLAL